MVLENIRKSKAATLSGAGARCIPHSMGTSIRPGFRLATGRASNDFKLVTGPDPPCPSSVPLGPAAPGRPLRFTPSTMRLAEGLRLSSAGVVRGLVLPAEGCVEEEADLHLREKLRTSGWTSRKEQKGMTKGMKKRDCRRTTNTANTRVSSPAMQHSIAITWQTTARARRDGDGTNQDGKTMARPSSKCLA